MGKTGDVPAAVVLRQDRDCNLEKVGLETKTKFEYYSTGRRNYNACKRSYLQPGFSLSILGTVETKQFNMANSVEEALF